MIELVLPFPPTVNHYWVNTKRGVFLSREAKQYRTDVTHAVMRQLRPPWPRLSARLSIEVALSAPDRRHYDIDNRLKGLFDSLQHAAIFEDDGQIDSMTVEREPPCTSGYAKVRISEL